MNVIDRHVSDQDIESLARKLAEFTESLTPGERMAFELIEQHLVAEVNADEMDVSGFTTIGTMSADAHRGEPPRQTRSSGAPERREGGWQTILSALTGGGDPLRSR